MSWGNGKHLDCWSAINHLNHKKLNILITVFLFQIQDGSWHQSHFVFHTQDSRQLPIIDIQEFSSSLPNHRKHLEIGPVCFFWPLHCPVTSSHKSLTSTDARTYFPFKEMLPQLDQRMGSRELVDFIEQHYWDFGE